MFRFDGEDDYCNAEKYSGEISYILRIVFIPRCLSEAEVKLIHQKQLKRLNARLEQKWREKVLVPTTLQYFFQGF